MSYQDITQYNSPNYTAGRPYGIACIVIHWWDDPARHPTFYGVISTLCSPARRASANYVAEAGRVACLVDPDNRSWASGDGVNCNSMGNDRGISIECNPRQSDGDYETIGELVRNLRNAYGDLPLRRHRDFAQTDCPGTYDLDRIDRIARGGASAPAAKPQQSTPAVNIDDLARRAIAGEFGNGDERKAKLGGNYAAVQQRVNEMLGQGGGSSAPSVDLNALADAVIRGDYGNGEERKRRLGGNYAAVQQLVNRKLGY
ncbi:MAG: N-acetylmuramoyl-L-alanine amidase [Bifidobacterium scardovii]|uniref:N-acetylmuramoyl-L-alanine amidase n=1 Tax=Bifidobacterium scardovii TaxID=158787 RepID=UPI0028FEF9F1|nr:N-acetylmuramoyl-L-alanine amidase [Bifidobacterium scardovii]MDU2421575.1 N-acetylmuramoyl-L-alanine amidase [Bifidobacterium scardovii]